MTNFSIYIFSGREFTSKFENLGCSKICTKSQKKQLGKYQYNWTSFLSVDSLSSSLQVVVQSQAEEEEKIQVLKEIDETEDSICGKYRSYLCSI